MVKISKKSFVKIATALIIVVAVIWLTVIHIQSQNKVAEYKRIMQSQPVMLELVSVLVNDHSAKVQPQNTCYNAEQGPFDDGRLRCEIEIKGTYQSAPDLALTANAIMERANSIFKAHSFKVSSYQKATIANSRLVADASYSLNRDMRCDVKLGAHASLDDFTTETQPFSIACFQHASENYFAH